jgi:hypothetical protein
VQSFCYLPSILCETPAPAASSGHFDALTQINRDKKHIRLPPFGLLQEIQGNKLRRYSE